MLMNVCVVPMAMAWVWGQEGWLKNLGFLDFSGASVIHLIGGMAGFVGALIIEPRLNRFTKGKFYKKLSFNENKFTREILQTIKP
jgi:Amt family ammonium transporter